MSRTIALVFAAMTAAALAAPPKIAVVRVTDIYTDLPTTKKRLEVFEEQKKAIYKDRRAEEIRKLVDELKAMQANLQKENSAADPNLPKLLSDYSTKAAAITSLQEDFESFKSDRTLEINREMVAYMRATFDRITKEAQAVAVQKGFDIIMDSSGNSNTGLPVLLYAKDTPDITPDVVAALSTAETAPPPPSAPPAPSPTAPTPAPAAPPRRLR